MNKIKCEKCRSVIAESTCEQFAIDGLIKCEACGMTYRHLHSEKIFDRTPDCAAELTTLRARVKELEANESTYTGLIGNLEAANIRLVSENTKQDSRIRELEEAMPGVDSLRGWATVASYTGSDTSLPLHLTLMADRIEAVMRKGEG